MSLLTLLGGLAVVLFAFGRFDYLGWQSDARESEPGFEMEIPNENSRCAIGNRRFGDNLGVLNPFRQATGKTAAERQQIALS
jgi:hypothetical protein